jgi:hypothetical protein
MEDVLDRVLPRIGGNGVIDQLAALSGSDFTSVMLEVARRRAARQTPASVLRPGARRTCGSRSRRSRTRASGSRPR